MADNLPARVMPALSLLALAGTAFWLNWSRRAPALADRTRERLR